MDESRWLSKNLTKSSLPTLVSFNQLTDGHKAQHEKNASNEATKIKSYHHIIELNQRDIERELRPLVTYTERSKDRKTFGQYTLVRRIGRGQYGDAYMAQASNGDSVAVKCISKRPKNPQQYSMNQVMRHIRRQQSLGRKIDSSDEAVLEMNIHKIRWEVFVTCRLKHSNILSVAACLDSPQSPDIWVVSPWATLGELRWKRRSKQDSIDQWDYLLRRKTNAEELAEYVLNSLCKGLMYLSEKGCVHRDIKPSNILVDGATANIMIADFGSSLMIPTELPFRENQMTVAYQEEVRKIAGTPAFTAPELCNFNEKDLVINGFQLDIWSLGVTIYCLLENVLPFSGENEFETFQKIVRDTIPHSNDWIHDLVVSKLLEKNPVKRLTVQDLFRILHNHKKEKGLKRFVSKFRKLNLKGKINKKVDEGYQNNQWESMPNTMFEEIDSDLSSKEDSFDEPILVPDFVSGAKSTTNASITEIGEKEHPQFQEVSPSGSFLQTSQLQLQSTPEPPMSDTSLSPIKIDTPLKNLIRTQNTPEKDSPHDKIRSSNSERFSPVPANTNILASQGTLNITKYLQSPKKMDGVEAKDSRTSYRNTYSAEDIRRYLKFAES
ncbi:LAME_0H12464g1_1 [Lachancea meyersii CBS 8951]|uniref:non-specific serine/threonine protein kinase n=1 Tax=Lachancea meyersii CBS 8951 TaxID=1266667 RepID=A0A1G4KGQ9_9SACH|nr:LAME_0H12464g1_1 [Lachancea meyersii CBS 8951]